MNNPLEQPKPDEVAQQVAVFARDFVYGVKNGLWGAEVGVSPYIGGEEWVYYENIEGDFAEYIKSKWGSKPPKISLLMSFDYFKFYQKPGEFETHYLPTEKAFQLLEEPVVRPSVFITYRRKESSALALLVEARLRLVDSTLYAFVDKDIPTQTRWEQVLKEKVEDTDTIICLIAPDTLNSKYVQNEINQAIASNSKIISILHLGYKFPKEQTNETGIVWGIIQELRQWQTIEVQEPVSAEKYEIAINRLLNDMGYSTY